MVLVLTGRAEELIRTAVEGGEYSSPEEFVSNALEAVAADRQDWEPTPEQEALLMRRIEEADREDDGELSWRT